MLDKTIRETFVEINLDDIASNYNTIKNIIGRDVAITSVVKCNAYGHGAMAIASTLVECGTTYLGVATLSEALEIKKRYMSFPVLIMGYTSPKNYEYLVGNDITQSIYSIEQAIKLNETAYKINKIAKVHIKIDTGFNRLGFKINDEATEDILKIFKLKNIEGESIFSHLALTSKEENENQYNQLLNIIRYIENKSYKIKYKHICDSIAAMDFPEYRMNMIRPGALLYGMKSYKDNSIKFNQALKFKTIVSNIKKLNIGEGVSYKYSWKAKRKSIIGTVPVGYGDGLPRVINDGFKMFINGSYVPIVGKICMDQCMLDLTDVSNPKIGNEVTIYGDGVKGMDIQSVSKYVGTNKNEILCRFSRRVPRIYYKNGKKVTKINYLL